MPVEFQVTSLRIQIRERLPEEQSEQARLQQLLELGETRVHSMAILEQEQRRRKAFVDRHRKTRKGFYGGKTGISLSDTDGTNARKIAISLGRPVLDSGSGKRDIYARYASRRSTTPKIERASVETVFRTYATKSIPRRTRGGRKIRALNMLAHMYFNVTLTAVPYRYI